METLITALFNTVAAALVGLGVLTIVIVVLTRRRRKVQR